MATWKSAPAAATTLSSPADSSSSENDLDPNFAFFLPRLPTARDKSLIAFLNSSNCILILSMLLAISAAQKSYRSTKEPREHHKSRHVLRKYHLIREIIGRGDVRICKIPTEENVADPLTKPLARVKHEAHANSVGMQYLEASS
ncbi:hypothetical protein OSB04_027604 [Centaurea solstitialis]|uniref:Uncharacterized protein n=1 Tax=Centaurea solstitialis TaxID=347529 RepID=A0AA38SLK4_9ASTR|nr:hypothetical protein OSB04_027604 [Centaurea solstitialis]